MRFIDAYRSSAVGGDGERDEEEVVEARVGILIVLCVVEVFLLEGGRTYGFRCVLPGPYPMGALEVEATWVSLCSMVDLNAKGFLTNLGTGSGSSRSMRRPCSR